MSPNHLCYTIYTTHLRGYDIEMCITKFGFFDVFFLYKVRAQRFHADVGIVEMIADDGEHHSDLIRFHVHGQTFDNEKHFAPHFYLLGPCRIEHGTIVETRPDS